MTSIRASRTKFNNSWPAKFLFPAEEALSQRLATHNLVSIFLPAPLVHTDDHGFQTLLTHCIDALDNLPLRPDFSFDQIWKALDAEFFRLKSAPGIPSSHSRFAVFANHIVNDPLCSGSYHLLAPHIPLQTCEFFAKRILDSTADPNEHSEQFIKRVGQTLGAALLQDIHAKYDADWLTPTKRADTQRRLGSLIKLIISGAAVALGGNSYQLSQDQTAQLLISTILPQFRNERFHGTVRPPFRSSSASLKTYAHSYFLLIYAYSLMCEVLLYRAFSATNPTAVTTATQSNLARFLQVLGDQENA
ncbi:MAG: hypothetical protein J0I15_16595 [Herbaspirillum huttiense]|uniref:hypothetical protein n=1 Tax=Herbaspirillum huttiense TaxID=863372 RepID=UPI001ACDCF52|nr:hypothetical protein [Herbaspirillum huttiense]MBN9358071.1 hypothetical protein [Herbaspirillum huttiense]